MRIDNDGPYDRHDLESVYLTHMRAAREHSFAAVARRATDLRTACWAAAQLAEQRAPHSRMQALAWARRCCQAYAKYRAAILPEWVLSMAAFSGFALPIDEALPEHQDPLFVTVRRVRRQWAELPESSFG
ncbi:hypothetical protein [Lentzea sp.]|uniref:hypothetical protein n=1 Tax=Lentzea sp. TaxID=56099 RepID=UPI002CFF98E3|nr:hypothetical protein [Lentzea sp.]HUQ55224.1 hypothetical protein [Lentzea sp.]